MEDRETCPVARTAKIVSGKWTLLIFRDLAGGTRRFNELERSLQGISPKTLSQRLRGLEKAGMIERRSYPQVPPRVEYSLTHKGLALIPVIEKMRDYGANWLGDECPELGEELAEPARELVHQGA
ncbi:MAG TPA: helix-turn-helix domain-containing protein [Dehalococcoidia bacterium]|nr:helix-turn-helix domain-containing protein [Dehalococcoidia bacterium]